MQLSFDLPIPLLGIYPEETLPQRWNTAVQHYLIQHYLSKQTLEII